MLRISTELCLLFHYILNHIYSKNQNFKILKFNSKNFLAINLFTVVNQNFSLTSILTLILIFNILPDHHIARQITDKDPIVF